MMKAMVLDEPRSTLHLREIRLPRPSADQVLARVVACGVCRTDLHIVDGELSEPKLPLVPGHQIVGRVAKIGENVTTLVEGDRIGIPWLGRTCGRCRFCSAGSENLCDNAVFTGYGIDGGFAEYTVAEARYCFRLPDAFDDVNAAPLLCAGLIGYRSLRMAEETFNQADANPKLGLYGFGAAAHIVAQIAVHRTYDVYAFVRPGDRPAADFAYDLGAQWAGPSDRPSPHELDAAIIFAPVGALVPLALRSVRKGGRVVCAGIHMSDIPSFPYDILWGERSICSIANLTRRDGEEFFKVAPDIPVTTTVSEFSLANANQALNQLRSGKIDGAAVLRIG